jgi:DNA-directed RNA polymerase specialized sigma subunit
MSLDEVAQVMGLSRQRVSQLEQSGLKKCREALRRRGLRLDDLLDR